VGVNVVDAHCGQPNGFSRPLRKFHSPAAGVRSLVIDPDGRAPLIAHLKLRAIRQVRAGRSVIVEVEDSATRS
jgi:hypothetical protein